MKHLFFLSFLIAPLWIGAAEDCVDPAAMAAGYKAAIGHELYSSEGDFEWIPFHSKAVTPKLKTYKKSVDALEGLKDILFEEVRRIYPYEGLAGESPTTLYPFVVYIRPGGFLWLHYYWKSARYRQLGREFLQDFANVWMVKVGMEDGEKYPSSTFTIFLLGQTSCGNWAGLRTFSTET